MSILLKKKKKLELLETLLLICSYNYIYKNGLLVIYSFLTLRYLFNFVFKSQKNLTIFYTQNSKTFYTNLL